MKYPAAIEWRDGTAAIGIHIPDLEISSAGDTCEEAYSNAVEVAHIALQNFPGQGKDLPVPTSADQHRNNDEYQGMG